MLKQFQNIEVIVFPFGRDSRFAIDVLLSHGFHIQKIWDNYKAGTTYRGIPVEHPAQVKEKDTAVLVYAEDALINPLFQQAVQLCKCVYYGGDIMRCFDLTHEEYRNNFMVINQSIENEWHREHPQHLSLHSLELPITERCSLKCRDCSNLMQYFTHPQDANIAETLSDADKILRSVDRIEQLRLLGGEPFVSNQLHRYVNHFVELDKIGFVHIYSNGTILPTGENLKCLKHKKVFVNISNYGKISKKIADIQALFQKEEILYRVVDVTQWTNCSTIKKRERTAAQQQEVFFNCCANGLLTLKNGRLYICPFLANAYVLKAIPKDTDESLLLSNYDCSTLHTAIKQFLKKEYFAGCNFCASRPLGIVDIPAAIQTKQPLMYRKYDD